MIISQYGKCLFTTKHNEKQGDGQNLVFLSCNIYLSLCLYLQSFVMNVCVSTDWWWKESAPTAWLFRPSDLYSSHTQIWEPSLPSVPFQKVNVLFGIIFFAPLFQLTNANFIKAVFRCDNRVTLFMKMQKHKKIQPTSCPFLPCCPKKSLFINSVPFRVVLLQNDKM